MDDLNGTEIAIVGMAGRYPNAETLQEFWRKVEAGEEFATFYNEDELREMGVDEETIRNPNWVPAAGMLAATEEFDAAFFGYNPKESSFMDPQQRHFLEVAWEALEDAGYDTDRFEGSIGVYGGSAMDTYLVLNIATNPHLMTPTNKVLIQVGNDNSYLTTRVSYKLNLKGPSHTLQCACSTSLVATHLACQSLLNEECDMALVGGATVHAQGKAGYLYLEGGVASPDGKCRTFDAQGKGPIFNSGVAVVVLKRLEDAIASRDHIYAVIKGSAINNDGSLKVSYAAPSVTGQAEVISEALAMADVPVESIGYVEAHGTATPLGDPIEIQALTQAYRAETDRKQFCGIGSVKSNVGHLDAAAGATSLIKAALALKNKKLPASLHFKNPNPQLDFPNSPFYVVNELKEWAKGAYPRRAGVSSFGIGGTNAHAILEEVPDSIARRGSQSTRPYQLVSLSARTATALDKATANLAERLRQNPDLNLADVGYTLHIGRKAFDHRRTIVARDVQEAITALERGNLPSGVRKGVARPVVFMFSGQGSQYPDMTRDLYQAEPTFRAIVDECATLLKPHLGLDLRTILLSEHATTVADQLVQTAITQPALFVVEYALAKLWMEWGVQPSAMIGHSIGEYVAACLAGVFSLHDVLKLVAVRGKFMQGLPRGSMLAVPLSEQEIHPYLNADLNLAALNEPSRCVVSGPTEAIETLAAQLEAKGIQSRPLHTSHAFHSAMMEPILEPFAAQVRGVTRKAPQIRFVSNVTGTWITDAQATDPTYWTTHLRQAVRFADGVGTLAQEPNRILLEVGPGRTLATLAGRHPDANGMTVLASLRHPEAKGSNHAFLLNTLGQLWMAGVEFDWDNYYRHEERFRVSLPTYPWERQRYWIEPGNPNVQPVADEERTTRPQKNALNDWFYIPSWKRTLPPVTATDLQGASLLFMDDTGVGARLVDRLTQGGATVVMVKQGAEYVQTAPTEYTLHPGNPAHYDQLLRDVAQCGVAVGSILHFWNVTASATPSDPVAHAEAIQQTGFYSLLYVAQALARQAEKRAVTLRVFSSDMQSVAAESTLDPAKATLLGAVKVIAQEYEEVTCQSLDLTIPPLGTWQAEQLLDQLLAEVRAPITDGVIAYRGYDRWVQQYEATPLPSAPDVLPRLREGGVYLITGGLGGIGLEVAQYLAGSVRARLVLTSRSAPRPDHQEMVAALETMGAEVLVVQADVTDVQAIQGAVHATLARFGALHGVLHAAGVPGGGIIPLKKAEAAATVLAPKVTGTLLLNEAVKDIPLDFFLLFSSITAVTGGFGQIDYTAANSFMDAFAHANRAQRGVFTVSVNWDAWQKVGMAVNTQHLRTLPTQSAGKPVGHPLLHTYQRESDSKATFTTHFSAEEHWVLSEHRVMGKPTIPGATYPEMAYTALVHHTGAQAVDIEELLFITPFMTGDHDRKAMTVTLEKQGEAWDFELHSGNGSGKQAHVRGKVRERALQIPQRHDLPTILQRCTPLDVQALRGQAGMAKFVDTGPRWECIRAVYAGNNEGVAVLELSPEFAHDTDLYHLHPTLMDIATAFAIQSVGQGNYLPLAYGKLAVHGGMAGRIYCYVRVPDHATSANKETVMVDVVIMDEQGVTLVDITGFSVKRVAEDAAQRLMAAAQQAATAAEPAAPEAGWQGLRNPQDGILPEEGIEALTRILAYNHLPQIIVSTRDLQTTIREINAFNPKQVLEGMKAAPVVRKSQKHPRPFMDVAYVAPRNEPEQQLATLWQEVLGIEQVGINDNFFALGGDSMMGTQIMAQAKTFGLEMTPAQFFQYQTIAELGALVAELQNAKAEGAEAPAMVPIAMAVAEEEQLLANLDHLSEEEMDALLAQLEDQTSGD
jgi:phthiocerol/phenolphthiocerol synthesis type-I polyketide synthase E